MRHLEREENGRAMKAWVARCLAPLAQTRSVNQPEFLGLHERMGSVLPHAAEVEASRLCRVVWVALLLWTM